MRIEPVVSYTDNITTDGQFMLKTLLTEIFSDIGVFGLLTIWLSKRAKWKTTARCMGAPRPLLRTGLGVANCSVMEIASATCQWWCLRRQGHLIGLESIVPSVGAYGCLISGIVSQEGSRWCRATFPVSTEKKRNMQLIWMGEDALQRKNLYFANENHYPSMNQLWSWPLVSAQFATLCFSK